jgi:hypothetical protein
MLQDHLQDLTASKSPDVPPVDGVIGSVSQTSTKASSKQKSVSNTGSNNPSKNSSNPGKTSEVHVVQSTTADKASKGKKKGKGKAKADTPKQDPPKSSVDDASKESRNILASSVRKIITPRIVPDVLKLVAY